MTIPPSRVGAAFHSELDVVQDPLSCSGAIYLSGSDGLKRPPSPHEGTNSFTTVDGNTRRRPLQCELDAQQRDNDNGYSGDYHVYDRQPAHLLHDPLVMEGTIKSNTSTAALKQGYYAPPQPNRSSTAQKRKPFHSLTKCASFDCYCESCSPCSLDQEWCSSNCVSGNNNSGVNNSKAQCADGAAFSSSADVGSHSPLTLIPVGSQISSFSKTRNGSGLLQLISTRPSFLKEQLGGRRSGHRRWSRCILPAFHLTTNKGLMLLGIVSIIVYVGMTTMLHSVISSAARVGQDRKKVKDRNFSLLALNRDSTGHILAEQGFGSLGRSDSVTSPLLSGNFKTNSNGGDFSQEEPYQVKLKHTYTDPYNESIAFASSSSTRNKKMAPPRIIFYTAPFTQPFSILPLPVRRPHFTALNQNETELLTLNSTEIASVRDLVRDSDDEADIHQPKHVLDPMLRVTPGEESAHSNERMRISYEGTNCVPMQEWQEKSFPNCNSVHELDMGLSGQQLVMSMADPTARKAEGNGTRVTADTAAYSFLEDTLFILGRGWFRHVWRVDIASQQESVVLKTLRLEREFYDEFYDLHRRDAMAMERLTHSPYIIDVYGYCGQTAINEFADFIDGYHDFQAFAKQMRNMNDPKITMMKLQIAAMLAFGVAHIHEVDGVNNATMVHYDINPKNVVIVNGGKPKLNDFNVAEFLRWDTVKNERCGFEGRLHEPWWRAPEEMYLPKPALDENGNIIDPGPPLPKLDEKVDVYSLGNILHNLLTGHSPRGKTVPSRIEQAREDVKAGRLPYLSDFYEKSKDPTIKAMRRAIKKCYVLDPARRSTAREIAIDLLDALKKIKRTL